MLEAMEMDDILGCLGFLTLTVIFVFIYERFVAPQKLIERIIFKLCIKITQMCIMYFFQGNRDQKYEDKNTKIKDTKIKKYMQKKIYINKKILREDTMIKIP